MRWRHLRHLPLPDREKKHLTEADLAAGYRMACQTFVSGDIAVSWIPRGPNGKPISE